MKLIKMALAVVALVVAVGLGFVYGGLFNVAADDPHWGLTQGVLEATRQRSIVTRARDVPAPPKLDDPKLIAAGAQEYDEMCTGCHLAPGMEETEIRTGLYPKPPNLSEPDAGRKPAEAFWVIKHGLKMTGMPAWGLTHDDQRIWSMVAFVQKLPELSKPQYEALIAQGEGAGHMHGDMAMPLEEEEAGEHPHHETKASDDADEEAKAGLQLHSNKRSDSHPHTHSEGGAHSHIEQGHEGETTRGILPAAAAEPVALVERFFNELAIGNTNAASALLDPGVLIYESGNAERSREEYASHHLASDAKFLKSVKARLLSRTGDAVSDWAWVASEANFSGTADNQPVNVIGTETMILRKRPGGWRIVHIHWSNRPAAGPAT